MSYHSGVSCDSCMVSNFPGRRYKCLLCDNYDLCGKCFDEKAESRNHKNSHAMQCILTDTAAEVFYRGETIACRAVVSLTCPHCAQMGFIPRTLLAHCAEKHSSQGKNTPAVMCPICVASALHKGRSRFAALTEHIGTDHDDANVGTDDDLGALFLGHVRRTEAEEDSDEEADEEDEGPSWNDLEHSGFVEEERRRQQTARQRLANSSTLSAAIRNEYIAALSGNTMSSNGQRRSLSRQTAVRIPRGGYRGHFSSFPYGSTMRTNAGASSSVTGRNVPDTQTVSASQNTVYNDPYASLFSQDPLLEFISQIANGQCTSTGSTTNSSNTQLLVAPFVPVHMTSVTNTYSTDLARLQQQIENSETMTQMKTTLLNNKQKRSSQNQQQSSSQSATLNHLSAQEFQLWQQQLPGVQTNLSPSTILNNPHGNDLTFGNNSLSYSSLKLSHQDSDPRSLLGKIVRHETNVNTGEIDETRRVQLQDHVSFLHSLLLCSMTNSSDNDENQTKLTNKENHL